MITKETTNLSGRDFESGQVMLIDKPYRWSSFKVIHEVRKTIRVKKVGHAGTLDPLATGLLIICTGKKTKEITSFQDQQKSYTGIITLGKSTPSMDLESESTEELPVIDISNEQIYSARNNFIGNIEQVPPMYSAVKYKGKPLYKLARKGRQVERAARHVTISKFEITSIKLPDIFFEINCSKGTYIRVIANDMGEILGCGGVLSSLRRTAIGEYSVNDALKIEDFREAFSAAEHIQ